jgi:hypothetical protein
LLVLCLGACQQNDGGGDAPTASGAAATTAATTATASATAARQHPYEGGWKGSYKAQRVTVTIPEKVKDKSWDNDDGKELAGEGQIDLRVDGKGEVTGTSKGALGELHIRGLVEENTLRAGLTPALAEQAGGMHGVLVGDGDGKEIDALLKVSGHDGTIARESRVKLTRSAD